ncbi:MAG: glycosyltransferase family 39 protein [Anaerolineales bacterium]
MKTSVRILIAILVVTSMILPRVADLAKFTAADEPFWLVVGANYYYALTHGEFENTVYEYHPAVTTMWIGTAAMLVYFPEYRGLMKGYFQQEKTSFDSYLVEHGKNPLVLLWWARFFQMLVNVFLFIVAFFLLRYLLDEWTALAAILLTSFAPYLFGQSRMLNHESMVGLFSLITVLAMTAHLFHKPKPALLFLSASAVAYANLTKSSSIVLFPVMAVMIFVALAVQWRTDKKTAAALGNFLKTYGLWFGIFVLVYFVSWPGMWADPAKMLHEVYGNAFSYAFEGARLSVTQEVTAPSFSLSATISSFAKFVVSIGWHTTPLTWLGLILAILFLFSKNQEQFPLLAKYIIFFLLLEALACVGMFSVVSGRDQPHYVLAAYYGIEFSAGLGWIYALRWLARSFPWADKPLSQTILFAVLLIAQAYPLFYTAPYYFTYLNPVMSLTGSRPATFFYGEGMEQAAAYLAEKPDAKNDAALVYFGRSFSYYYPGQTLLFKPILFDDQVQLKESLRQVKYIVIYIPIDKRLPFLENVTPEHVIDLNGGPYINIYRVSDIPSSFFSE